MSEFRDVEQEQNNKSVLGGIKVNYKYKLNKEQLPYIEEMVQKRAKVEDDYVSYAKKYDDWEKLDATLEQSEKQNRMYYMALLGICAVPLRRGVNAHSVATCMGMYFGISLMNPEFKKNVKGIVREAMLPYYDEMKNAFPNSKFAKLVEKVIPDKEQVVAEMNHGRLPFTPETAALKKVAWIEKFYDDVRRPGADVEKLAKSYNKAVDAFDRACERDGVSQKEVSSKMQSYIMKRMQLDPSYAKYFNELDNGMVSGHRNIETFEAENGDMLQRVTFSPGKDDDGNTVYFYDNNGDSYQGDFTPRMPSSGMKHAKEMSDICESYMNQISHIEDLGKYNSDPYFATREELEFVKYSDDIEHIYPSSEYPDSYYQTHYGAKDRNDWISKTYDNAVEKMANIHICGWYINPDIKSSFTTKAEFDEYEKQKSNLADKLKADMSAATGRPIPDMSDDDFLKSYYEAGMKELKNFNVYEESTADYTTSNEDDKDFESDTETKEKTEKTNKNSRRGPSFGTDAYEDVYTMYGDNIGPDF